MSDMRLRDNSTPSLGGTQSPYTRNGSDLNPKDYQNRSYVRPAAPPPLDMRTPTTGTSVPLTPSYTYPSGNTSYTTPSMTRYTPSPPPSGMSRPMQQPEYSYKRMDQPSAIPIQPTQPGQTYPLSNPDTFRPRYSQYSGSSQAVPSPYQHPQQAIPIQSNQRISYARTQGNIVSPSSSSIQNSQGYNINTPVYQGQQQAQPYPSFPSPSSIQGTRSFSQTPSRQAGSGFPRPVDTRTALSEVWNRLESNRDMQRSLKNMLSECVEMLVSVARSLAFAVEQGSVDWQEVSVVHRRGLDAWRQEVSRRFPVESPFVIREFVGCDMEFLGDLVQGFKKRSDSQSRNQKNERTIHLERSSSNQQSAFVEIDSGLQTPSSRGQQPLVLKIVMDGQGSSDYTDQPGFTQTVVEKSQTRPYLNQTNKTPEKQVPNRLYKYLDSKTQEKSPTSKNLAAQAQQTQQLGNVTKQDALFSSAGLEVDRDLLEHRKKVQNRFSPFKRDTGPQGDFDLVLTTETKTTGTDADKYSKYNQKVLAEAEIFRKHQNNKGDTVRNAEQVEFELDSASAKEFINRATVVDTSLEVFRMITGDGVSPGKLYLFGVEEIECNVVGKPVIVARRKNTSNKIYCKLTGGGQDNLIYQISGSNSLEVMSTGDRRMKVKLKGNSDQHTDHYANLMRNIRFAKEDKNLLWVKGEGTIVKVNEATFVQIYELADFFPQGYSPLFICCNTEGNIIYGYSVGSFNSVLSVNKQEVANRNVTNMMRKFEINSADQWVGMDVTFDDDLLVYFSISKVVIKKQGQTTLAKMLKAEALGNFHNGMFERKFGTTFENHSPVLESAHMVRRIKGYDLFVVACFNSIAIFDISKEERQFSLMKVFDKICESTIIELVMVNDMLFPLPRAPDKPEVLRYIDFNEDLRTVIQLKGGLNDKSQSLDSKIPNEIRDSYLQPDIRTFRIPNQELSGCSLIAPLVVQQSQDGPPELQIVIASKGIATLGKNSMGDIAVVGINLKEFRSSFVAVLPDNGHICGVLQDASCEFIILDYRLQTVKRFARPKQLPGPETPLADCSQYIGPDEIYIPWACSQEHLYLLDSMRDYNLIEFKNFFVHKAKDPNSTIEELSILIKSDDQATVIVAAYGVNSEFEGNITMFTLFVAQGNLNSLQFKQIASESGLGLAGFKDKFSQLTGKSSNAISHELSACATEQLPNSITYSEADIRVINQDKKIPMLCLSCDKQIGFGVSFLQEAQSRVSDSTIMTGRENRSPSDILGVLAGMSGNLPNASSNSAQKSTDRIRAKQREGSEVFSLFAFFFSPPFAPLGSFTLPIGKSPRKLLASPTQPNVILVGTDNSLLILYFEKYTDPEAGQAVRFTLVREIEIVGPKVLDFTLIRNFVLAKNENNEIIELDFSAEL